VEALGRHLNDFKGIRRWETAGSFRRCRETVGDLDVLVQAADREAATEHILKYPAIRDVLSRGGERVSVHLDGGVQVDILKDGQLDLDTDLLADLDWVVASIHSRFEMSRAEQTRRLVNAVRSGVVHCLGHPTGRMIGHRDPILVDWDEVFAACREHGVRLEINAQPERLDLPDHLCREARQAGIGFAIATDAHKQANLEFMRLGVGVARRGWLEKGDVLNTLPASRLRQALKQRVSHGRSDAKRRQTVPAGERQSPQLIGRR
jgi:histidinol phosphatase-like PHP family hydrolase